MRFKYYLRGAGIGVIVATLVLSVAFLFHDNISDEEVIRRAMKLGMVMQESNAGTLADPPASDASSADLEGGAGEPGGTITDPDPLAGDSDPNGTGEASGSQDGTGAADGETDPQQPSEGEPSTDPEQGQDPGEADGNPDSQDNQDQKDDKDKQGDKDDSKSKTDNKTSDKKPSGNKTDNSEKTSDDKPEDSDEVEIVIESGDVSRMVSAKVFEAGLVDSADEFNSYLGANDYDNMLQPGTYKIKKGSSFRQIAQILTRQ
ncbi:MAG: hypothetical protein K2N87_20315 [Eubacterium sp.]|nr:hypothetical protein [Eubacterium sp.]